MAVSQLRAIRHAPNASVRHWIPMDVIDMPDEVVFTADQVFPESALPQAAFTPLDAA